MKSVSQNCLKKKKKSIPSYLEIAVLHWLIANEQNHGPKFLSPD